MPGDLRYRCEWDLDASPVRLWPLVSNTNRFKFETGVPSVDALSVEQDGTRRLRARVLRRGLEFEEEPFEWIRPERFAVRRRYGSGLRGFEDEPFALWRLMPRG